MFTFRAASLVLAVSFFGAASASPAFSQNGNGNQQSSSPTIVGTWLTGKPQQDGSTLFTFEQYSPNGIWRMSLVRHGGPNNGTRNQVWGKYSFRPVGTTASALPLFPPVSRLSKSAPRASAAPGCQAMPRVPPKRALCSMPTI